MKYPASNLISNTDSNLTIPSSEEIQDWSKKPAIRGTILNIFSISYHDIIEKIKNTSRQG